MLTPLGVLGGLRGVFYAGMGGAAYNGYSFTAMTRQPEVYTPLLGYDYDIFGNATPIYGPPQAITGFRLKDARASYGIGLETSLLGLPMHFDWSWRTLFNRTWENNLFAAAGGSPAFRKVKFSFWIGYDF